MFHQIKSICFTSNMFPTLQSLALSFGAVAHVAHKSACGKEGLETHKCIASEEGGASHHIPTDTQREVERERESACSFARVQAKDVWAKIEPTFCKTTTTARNDDDGWLKVVLVKSRCPFPPQHSPSLFFSSSLSCWLSVFACKQRRFNDVVVKKKEESQEGRVMLKNATPPTPPLPHRGFLLFLLFVVRLACSNRVIIISYSVHFAVKREKKRFVFFCSILFFYYLQFFNTIQTR